MMRRFCTDRVLTRDLRRPLHRVGDRAISPVNRQWDVGQTLTYAFIGGAESQRAIAREAIQAWKSRLNLVFEERTKLPATLRIAFDSNDGAWSYVGTDALEIPASYPTLNLGWDDLATALHEVGHAVGLAHEHQNPQGGIKWNEAAVLADLSGPPNYWDPETVMDNVIRQYALSQVIGTAFDRESIMLYAIPVEWTLDGFWSGWNQKISAQDAAFVSSTKMYPFAKVTLPRLQVAQAYSGAVAARGEIDEYEFEVVKPGRHNVATLGGTDLVMSVYSGEKLLQSDDNSGPGRNPLVVLDLAAGVYRVAVRHASLQGTGNYQILTWRS